MQLVHVWACKLRSKSMRASRMPNGKVTFEVTSCWRQEQKENFFASVIIRDFCAPHPNFDLPLIMPVGIITTWCERSKTEVQKRGSAERGMGGKSANPLTGFRCSCRHEWPVGGVKAAHCDMANLRPQAAQELGACRSTRIAWCCSHWWRPSAAVVILNYQDRGR